MATDPNDPLLDAIPDGYKFVREEIRFQHTLLGYRLGWFLTAQAFLCTACSISIHRHSQGVYWFSGVLLPVTGLVLAVLMHFGVASAKERIDGWRRKEQLFEGRHALVILAPQGMHSQSLWFPTWSPWLFAGFWILVAVLVHVARLPA